MRKPNYSWEKRQRELAKQKKKEEKRNKKLSVKNTEIASGSSEPTEKASPERDGSQD